MDECVYFVCVKVKSRLRIRIISQGYKKEANCQFPRNIRKEGRRYKASPSDVVLSKGPAGKYFYRVKKSSIEVLEDEVEVPEKIYHITDECSVCMDAPSDVIIVPCGHYCLCNQCANVLKTKEMSCPICRGEISRTVTEDQIQC